MIRHARWGTVGGLPNLKEQGHEISRGVLCVLKTHVAPCTSLKSRRATLRDTGDNSPLIQWDC